MARRDEGIYCGYLTEEQRPQPGCSGARSIDLAIPEPSLGRSPQLLQYSATTEIRRSNANGF